jgi:hypothetical protein
MVFRPKDGPAQLIVLGSTRLDSYYLETGELRWWMPLGSGGALGTPVAANYTLFVSTVGQHRAALAMYDKDYARRLSRAGVPGRQRPGGALRLDRNSGLGEFGAIAIQPGATTGKLEEGAVRWRFKMVRTGGIITSLDPATGRLLKQGRSRDAIGEYYASPACLR